MGEPLPDTWLGPMASHTRGAGKLALARWAILLVVLSGIPVMLRDTTVDGRTFRVDTYMSKKTGRGRDAPASWRSAPAPEIVEGHRE